MAPLINARPSFILEPQTHQGLRAAATAALRPADRRVSIPVSRRAVTFIYIVIVTDRTIMSLRWEQMWTILGDVISGASEVHATFAMIVASMGGWLITTYTMLSAFRTEVLQFSIEGRRYFFGQGAAWNVFDIFRILPMLTGNLMLLTRNLWWQEADWDYAREVDGRIFTSDDQWTTSNFITICFSFSVLFFGFRAISFFRGWLSFATLVYSIGVILTNIVSFLIVLVRAPLATSTSLTSPSSFTFSPPAPLLLLRPPLTTPCPHSALPHCSSSCSSASQWRCGCCFETRRTCRRGAASARSITARCPKAWSRASRDTAP